MIHPQIIAENIALAERSLGHELKEYSVADARAIYDHFKSIERTDGKRTWYARSEEQLPESFAFVEWEARHIKNELAMCACSFPYFYYRYCTIRHLDGRIAPPDVLHAQQIFFDILAERDLKHLPILLLNLKARQLGQSTATEAIIVWIALFKRGSHCVIASAEEQKSIEMSEMLWRILENLPLWMQPHLTREDRRIGPEFGDNGSDILIQHGSQTKGISRGSTPVAAHLSEVAYYPDPIETIESSLIRAMHENPNTFLMLESTARRKGDWFHQTWLSNRKGEDTGYNRFTCLFLPWYLGKEKYPTVDWIRNHPIPQNWKPMEETKKQAQDAKLYVSQAPLLRKYMGENWEMPPEQQFFYEFNYVEARDSNDSRKFKSFRAEMASDEYTAFQTLKTEVFEVEVLDRLSEQVESAQYTDYAIIGDGIEPKFNLRAYQSRTAKQIDLNWASMTTGQTMNWRLIPLKETPRDDNLDFYLRIWEKPKAGFKYTIGVDVGSGIGQNKTVFDILRQGADDEPAVQVAQLASAFIGSYDAASFALVLGIYYGQFMSPTKEALMAPEVQIATGDFISDHLSRLGYTNFYYMERFDQRRHPGQKSMRRGWATVGWSRQMMMELYEYAIKSGWVIINSTKTLEELETLEADETESGKIKYDHAKNEEDDCYMAGGIAYIAAFGKVACVERMKSKLRPRKRAEVKVEDRELDTTEAMLARHFQREEQSDLDGEWDNDEVREVW